MSNQKTKKQIIENAAELLEEKGWTQRVFARDAGGMPVDSVDGFATCFCTAGAIIWAGHEINCRDTTVDAGFTDYLQNNSNYSNVIAWNDAPNQTAENVIKTLREYAATLDEGASK